MAPPGTEKKAIAIFPKWFRVWPSKPLGKDQMTFPGGIGGPMMSSCCPPYSVPPDWCIGAVIFCGQKTCCFFFWWFFFYPISLHTKPVLFSTFSRRRGVLPSIPCIFLLGGPISSPTDATVVLHWAYKRNLEKFDPKITALLIVAEKKIPEDNLLSNQKKKQHWSQKQESLLREHKIVLIVSHVQNCFLRTWRKKGTKSRFQKTERN